MNPLVDTRSTHTVSPNHYMREFSSVALRRMLAQPEYYSVGERLDADSILRERATS